MDKQYLNKHKIPELVNEVILQLVEVRPGDPKTFLANAILHTCEVDPGFPELSGKANILSRFLTPALYDKLKHVRSSGGFTLDRAIQTGVDNNNSSEQLSSPLAPGVVAGDEDCYTTFAELFMPILEAYHSPSRGLAEKFRSEFNPNKLSGALLNDLYVVSCRIRTVRNIRGFALPPFCTRKERREVCSLVTQACLVLPEDLSGSVCAIDKLSEEHLNMSSKGLIPDKSSSPEAVSSCLARDWPDARSVFINPSGTFAIWVNVKDHAKLISHQSGGANETGV